MAQGTVKWFNAEKGYGFIAVDGGRMSSSTTVAIQMDGYRTLEEGQRVEFEISQGQKGRRRTWSSRRLTRRSQGISDVRRVRIPEGCGPLGVSASAPAPLSASGLTLRSACGLRPRTDRSTAPRALALAGGEC